MHPITLFTHFKTNTKSIGIYRGLRCCMLLKTQNIVKFMKWARLTRDQKISVNDVCSIYSISLGRVGIKGRPPFGPWVDFTKACSDEVSCVYCSRLLEHLRSCRHKKQHRYFSKGRFTIAAIDATVSADGCIGPERSKISNLFVDLVHCGIWRLIFLPPKRSQLPLV